MTNGIFEQVALRPPMSPAELEREHDEAMRTINFAALLATNPTAIANGMRRADRKKALLAEQRGENDE